MIRFVLVILLLVVRPAYADIHQAMQDIWYDQFALQFPDKLPPRILHIQPTSPASFQEVSTIRPPALLALGETPYPRELKVAWDRLLMERFRQNPYRDHSALVEMNDPLTYFVLRAATITGVEPEPEPSPEKWRRFLKILW